MVGGGGSAVTTVSSSGGKDNRRLLEKVPQGCSYVSTKKDGSKSWKKLQCDHNHDYYRDAKSAQEERPDFNQCFKEQLCYDDEHFNKSKMESLSLRVIVFVTCFVNL